MRILYSFPHDIDSPGIGSIAYQQVRGLAANGLEVWLYCGGLRREPPGVARIVRTMVVRGVRIPRRLVGVDRAYEYHDRRVAAAVGRSGADAVHCWPLASVNTLRETGRLGIRSYREVPNTHTAYAYERSAQEAATLGLTMPTGYSHAFNPRRLALEEEEYRLADALLVPSPFVEQTFLERGFPRRKLLRHRYGFDPDRFPPRPSTDDVGNSARLVAAFVGRAEPRKGLHLALRAWLESGVSRSGRFVVCGSFLPGYAERIGGYLNHPSVDVRGFVSDVGAVLRQADVLVFPSLEEGSALVTYEAQASGCVTLVSDAAGAPCRHLCDGLVHRAGDAQTLAEHIRMVDRDRHMLERMRADGQKTRDQLSWPSAGELLASIYKTPGRILSGAPGGE